MNYYNIKVKVPTPEISRMVQEKLFEEGVRWRYTGGASVRHEGEKYLYVGDSLKMTQGGSDQEYFNQHSHKQVHYLQIITGDDTGRLFKYPAGGVYYQVGNLTYDYMGKVCSKVFELDTQIKRGVVKLLDVNEEEITMQSNEMPKLEAGKHVVKDNNGKFYLVLDSKEDGISGLNFEKYSWASDLNTDTDTDFWFISEVHQIKSTLGAMDEAQYGEHTLIWERDEEADKLREEYEKLQKQIKELQAQADKLGESL